MIYQKLAVLAGLLLLTVAASAPPPGDASAYQIHEDRYRISDKELQQVSFTPGDSTVPPPAQLALAAFVKQTQLQGKIDKYIVVAWSDKELPAQGELSKDDLKLAKARAEATVKALDSLGVKVFDRITMTKQPNWLQQVFSTESAELKGKGRTITNKERLNREIGEHLRGKGGPGSAVIIVKFLRNLGDSKVK